MSPKKTDKAGVQLKALMKAHHPPVSLSQLARDLGVTTTTIWRYLKDLETLDDGTWRRIAEVLRGKHGIDATEIRAVRLPPLAVDDSLTPHLDAFSTKEQLAALIAILERADQQGARDLLLVLARDRLTRR